MLLDQASSLLVVASAALLLPGVSRVLRIPAPVAEILFGVIWGKSLLQVQFGGDWLPFLADLGFLMLMFQAGMEIDFSLVARQSGKDVAVQVAVFSLTLLLALACTVLLDLNPFMALVLSTTSLGLVMPTLREGGMLKGNFGQRVLIAATMADFLTLLGITLFVLWEDNGLSWQLVLPLPMFLGFGVLLRLARLWAWWNPDKAKRILTAGGTQEIGVRLSFALLFAFVALSELVHIEPVLGAFMGGCVLGYVFRSKEELEEKISAIGFGFLVPVFFIYVGMQFNLGNLMDIERLTFTGMLLVVAFVVKVFPALLFKLRGMSFGDSLRAGILLASRLSLIVAAAEIGMERGLLTPVEKDSIVFLAVLTCFLGPTLFKVLLPKPQAS